MRNFQKSMTLLSSATVGKEPLGGLITDGTYLYGMTQWGGANNKGTIFKIKTDGTDYSLLYSFDNANGERPDGDLVLINNFLYGTTVEGGTNNVGVIFKIKRTAPLLLNYTTFREMLYPVN